MKKYVKYLLISTSILFAIFVTFTMVRTSIMKQRKNENNQKYSNVNQVNNDTEKEKYIMGKIEQRNGKNYQINLEVSADKCIKEIEDLETNQITQIANEENHLKLNTVITAQKNKEYNYKIVMASGLEKTEKFKVEDFIPANNKAPTKPVIDKWPEDSSIKKNRNVTIKATSQDEDMDKIEYVWEGRTNETSTYSIGKHIIRVKAVDLYGEESEWSECEFEVINVEAATVTSNISTNGNTNFNIRGNGNKTTYSDIGYSTVLKVNDNQTNITNGKGACDNVQLITSLEKVNDGNYIKIVYEVENLSNTVKTIGIATHADIMINNDDRATITNMNGNRGFTMTDGTYNYKVMLKNTANVTDVDTYWFGNYSQRMENLWNNSNIQVLTGVDSGMAYSWKDKKIKSGEKQIYTSIIGLE